MLEPTTSNSPHQHPSQSGLENRRMRQDRTIGLSFWACLLGFVGFLLWGIFAKLDEGVTATGSIVVEENRKAVQHFEGGIIRVLNVQEGQAVQMGDVLLELEPLQSESARDELAQEYAAQASAYARLSALRDNLDTIDFSVLDDLNLPANTVNELIARQRSLFDEQREAHLAQLAVLEARRDGALGRERDLAGQITATRAARDSAAEDLALRQQLLAERLETISNVQLLEREVARYDTDLSRLVGERNEARQTAGEVQSQIAEAIAQYNEEISTNLVDAQTQSLSAQERLAALDDRLARTVIRASRDGTVLNLAHSTEGGVVGAGEVIMEIVPSTDNLLASVRLLPQDRDAVAPGQRVKAQLTAYKSFVVDRLEGEVLSVSADVKVDEATGTPFYEARVRLDASSLDPQSRVEIIPGMPVDAFIASGAQRSFLDYVFEPIRSTVERGTRMG